MMLRNTVPSMIGAILAGGKSQRMGQPKHAVRLHDGRTMIQTVAKTLHSVDACADVVVVGARDVCAGALGDARLVEDQRTHAGPLGGIEALLASDLAERYLICGCDMPLLTCTVLEELVERAKADDQPAMVVFASDERVEPLPCVILACALPIVRELLDEQRGSVRALMNSLNAARVPIGDRERGCLRSFNTPEELTEIRLV